MSDDNQFLENWERDAVLYIEHVHSVTGAVPTNSDIIEYLRLTKGHPANSASINALKDNKLFRASMDSRGIVLNYKEDEELGHTTSLTQRQMAAASVMMNMADRRSDEKKLRDIGVSTEEWSNWMQDRKFSDYMRDRSEILIQNSVHAAHVGLLRGVNQGNTASIKLYYELTGRYNPNEESNVNIRMVIGRVLEAIQKHVRDPGVLNSLAVELSQIAIESGSPVDRSSSNLSSTSIKGELL